jgi:hypothetical protein
MSQQQYATPYGGGMAVVTGPSSGFYQQVDASSYWGNSGRYGAAPQMVHAYTVQGAWLATCVSLSIPRSTI